MKEKLLEALPLFIGAALGVWFYYSVLNFVAIVIVSFCLVVLGLMGKFLGRRLLPKHPVLSVKVWQMSVLVPVGLIALGGYITTYIVEQMPQWLVLIPGIDLAATNDDDVKALSGALSAAITAFLGSLFLDDHKNSEGGNWPPAQIKKAFGEVFGPEVNALKPAFDKMKDETDAQFKKRISESTADIAKYDTMSRTVFADEMASSGPNGWSLSAATLRAKTVEDAFLKQA